MDQNHKLKYLLYLIGALVLGQFIYAFFSNKNLSRALEKIEEAKMHIDSARNTVISIDESVKRLQSENEKFRAEWLAYGSKMHNIDSQMLETEKRLKYSLGKMNENIKALTARKDELLKQIKAIPKDIEINELK